jgi:hypothetical protein
VLHPRTSTDRATDCRSMSGLPDPSPVFETYWRFAAERQAIYERRLRGAPAPWTDDAILASFRFTNVFRASDRVSQFLVREVIYRGDSDPSEVIFRILLFKFFNRIETWELLENELGPITLGSFDPDRAVGILTRARGHGQRVYSNAYIVPPIPGWRTPKHSGHVRLAVELIESGLVDRVRASASLEDLFLLLRSVQGLGDFLAYQYAIDVCYSPVVDHGEDEFVVAGPGALDGLSKVFPGMDMRQAANVIRALTDEQEHWFEHFGLRFAGLFGRRLHLIDVQNLFCEIGKYARVAHPEYPGVAGRTRIKQTFKPVGPLPTPYFPPKWGLSLPGSNGRGASKAPDLTDVARAALTFRQARARCT